MSGADSFGMGRTFILVVLVVAGYMSGTCTPLLFKYAVDYDDGATFDHRHAAQPQRGS
jgi:hypothetical protein